MSTGKWVRWLLSSPAIPESVRRWHQSTMNRCSVRICARKVFFSGCLAGGALPLAAQAILTNAGQSILLTPGAVVAVRGGVVNNGPLTNHGTWSVSGDWENRNTYDGTGTFVLDGDQPQRVNHSPASGSRQSFHRLRLAGEGEKRLESEAEVTDTLVLEKGILTPTAENRFWMGKTVVITGGSVASHVNGMLIHQGTGNRFFPIGKAGSYQPVTLLVNEDNPSLGFEVFEPGGAPQLGPRVVQVSPARHWRKTLVAGTFGGALITLPVSTDDGVIDFDRVVVVAAAAPAGPYGSLGQRATAGTPTGGTVTSQLPGAAGEWLAVGVTDDREGQTEVLYLPNAFSPSAANGEERVFKIYSTGLTAEGLRLRIYDRWGSLVYETSSLGHLTQTGWDGRHHHTGRLLNPGIYTYTLNGKLAGGEAVKRVGTVTLVQ